MASWATTMAALNPTHWWRLGESSGNFADSGSGGQTLTNNGATYGTAGAIPNNDAITLAGVTGYADAGTDLLSGACSFGCWANIPSSTLFERILGQETSGTSTFTIRHNGSRQPFARFNSTNTTVGDAVTADWHFYVVTYNGSNSISLYVDDRSPLTASVTGSIDTSNFRLGMSTGDGFDGPVDEAFIFNGTALSAAQVLSLYESRNGVDGGSAVQSAIGSAIQSSLRSSMGA